MRRKRKQFRQKKKKLIREQKYPSLAVSPGDSGYTTSPGPPLTVSEISQSEDPDISTESASSDDSSDGLPRNMERLPLYMENIRMKQLQEQKEAELRQKYSKFVDEEQAHVFNPTTISIPNSVNPVDRCLIESKLKNVLYKEMKAVQQATIYRDKCTELKQKCRHLQTEKEAVRFFWRNRVLEGQSRAAKIFRKSVCQQTI